MGSDERAHRGPDGSPAVRGARPAVSLGKPMHAERLRPQDAPFPGLRFRLQGSAGRLLHHARPLRDRAATVRTASR